MIDALASSRFKVLLPSALLLIAIIPKLAGIELPISDSFHVGEAFAAAVTLAAKPGSSPLTIHGAWDFIPAILSRQLAGEQGYLYPAIYLTRSILPGISALILLVFLFRLLKDRKGPEALVFLSMAAIVAPSLVGIRDLFLLMACWSLYEFLNSANRAHTIKSAAALVLTTSAGAIWSFDRGIIGIATVISALIAAGYISRKGQYVSICLLVLAAVLSAVLISNGAGTMDYFANVLFLTKTSSQWRYPLSIGTAAGSALVVIFVLGTLGGTQKGRQGLTKFEFAPFWLGMSVCSIMMARVGINRADMEHILMAMWAPMLLSAYSFGIKSEHKQGSSYIRLLMIAVIVSYASLFYAVFDKSFAVLAITFSSSLLWSDLNENAKNIKPFISSLAIWVVCLSTLGPIKSLGSTIKGVANGRITNPIEYAVNGIPYSKIADPGNQWTANIIRNSGSECILDMTNSGIINPGAGLPTCTSLSYMVYATRPYEQGILRELKDANLNAIVYSTENWQYNIDGKNMKERFPLLDNYLKIAFPREECFEKYCIRRASPKG
jgi:hypothetical protein